MKTIEPTSLALQKAAQAWCGEKTSSKEMDSDLAIEFAKILDEIWSKPWLGNATTKELLDEVGARTDLEYRTVDN